MLFKVIESFTGTAVLVWRIYLPTKPKWDFFPCTNIYLVRFSNSESWHSYNLYSDHRIVYWRYMVTNLYCSCNSLTNEVWYNFFLVSCIWYMNKQVVGKHKDTPRYDTNWAIIIVIKRDSCFQRRWRLKNWIAARFDRQWNWQSCKRASNRTNSIRSKRARLAQKIK